VHAEENCIIQAAKSGGDPTGGTLITTSSPCSRCMRMLINAGIVEIVYDTRYDDELAFEMARMAHIDMERLVT
jgi:dCMP deaminase